MRIHCFGDSWTDGIGVELEPGSGILDSDQKYNKNWDTEKRKYSWPGYLQSFVGTGIRINNKGCAGYSNDEIYKEIIQSIWNGDLKKGDIVIVAFSSIIRQPLHFLYTQHGVDGFTSYSNAVFMHYKKGHMNDKLNWIESIENENVKNVTNEVYMDYIVNRFSYELLYELNMHYIANLQIYFENLGIKYVFLNAFEQNLSKDIKFYDQIKLEHWIMPEYSLQEYLVDKSKNFDKTIGYSLWEDDIIDVQRNQDGPHPNRIGYKLIAELIHSELVKMGYIKNEKIII